MREYSYTSDSFARLNVRATYRTAQKFLTKQLLCIGGTSSENVGAVAELYGLLRDLFQELKGAEGRGPKEKGEPELNAVNNGDQRRAKRRERRVWPSDLERP